MRPKATVSSDQLRDAASALLPRLSVSPSVEEELVHELHVHQIELEMQNAALRAAQIELEASRDRVQCLYDSAPAAYVSLSRECLITEANLTAARWLGVERTKLQQSQRFEHYIAAEDLERWRMYSSGLWRSADGRARECVLRMRCEGGESFFACLHSVLVRSGAEQVMRIVLSDVSARQKAEEAQRIAAIAFESQEGMMVTDAKFVIVQVNRAFTRLTGYSAGDVLGKTPRILRSGRHEEAFYRQLQSELEHKQYWQGEIWNKRKDGSVYAEWLTITAVCSPGEEVTHYVGAFSDITLISEAAKEIHRLAYYDPLTNLPNRRLLQDRLHQVIANAARTGLHGAVMFMDLDNFKALNDTLGHDAGDLLLIEVANRLRLNVRDGDTVARLGGDEFVLIIEGLGLSDRDAALVAQQIAEKINRAIGQNFVVRGAEVFHAISIGVTLFSAQDSVENLLKHSDLALYQSKAAGGNTVRFYDPMLQAALDVRRCLEVDLRQALQRDQFVLHFQPQLDSIGRVLGAECLLRWQHPERGMVAPGDFIPLAEESSLILSIGAWVMQQACAQLVLWAGTPHLAGLTLAVNVSARQFKQSDFVDEVLGVIDSSGVDPQRLKLEMTESMVLGDLDEVIAKMAALQTLGVEFSMDDFGTGFSSLSCLSRLPLSQLKIDRSFVASLPEAGSDAVIAATIISMGNSLGLHVIAEGVETVAQHQFLEQHACHAYQGYLFSKPLPLEEFEAFMVSQVEDET